MYLRLRRWTGRRGSHLRTSARRLCFIRKITLGFDLDHNLCLSLSSLAPALDKTKPPGRDRLVRLIHNTVRKITEEWILRLATMLNASFECHEVTNDHQCQ
jgi:hypothetical protein